MRLVFAGTPQTAVPALEALLASTHEVVAVVTRPDAPAGRGHRERGGRQVTPGAVALRARGEGLEVLTPARGRDPEFLDRLRRIGPDCCPVAAYGALLPRQALDIPRHGWVNLHFSLLPAWRGAAPVQHAILHGDDVTGASTFRIVEELDAGPVYGVVTEPIRADDTAGDLLARLSVSGARLLVATLDGIEAGTLQVRPQPAEGVSFAPKITPADARVDWTQGALAVDRRIRACTPAPGAWTTMRGTRVKLGPVGPRYAVAPPPSPAPAAGRTLAARADGGPVPDAAAWAGEGGPGVPLTARPAPGELMVCGGRVLAGTGTHPVVLGEVRPEGKRPMRAIEWVRGLRLSAGERLA